MSSGWHPPGRERCRFLLLVLLLPMCDPVSSLRYGSGCTRKNPLHFERFSHPPGMQATRARQGACGLWWRRMAERDAEEEVVIVLDSDEEDLERTKRRREEGASVSVKAQRTESAAKHVPSTEEDARLARKLQEQEFRGSLPAGAGGTRRSREFAADGRGFWLFHTEGIEGRGNEHALRLRDVVQGDIEWAILTNYMIQERWLLSEVPLLSSIPKVVLMYPFPGSGSSPPSSSIERYEPPTPSYGVHHSKVMLLGCAVGARLSAETRGEEEERGERRGERTGKEGKREERRGRRADGGVQWQRRGKVVGSQCGWIQEEKESSEFEDDLVAYFQATQWKGTKLQCGSKLDAQYLRRYSFKHVTLKTCF
eukprot:763034-Hanusia_phi.AAC.2